MAIYFLDTSAIVKRYITEPGQARVLSLCDAVQLACVLALHEYALVNQAPLPIFVCADVGLLDVAGVEGMQVENPNNYP
jgi:hypothetical protein